MRAFLPITMLLIAGAMLASTNRLAAQSGKTVVLTCDVPAGYSLNVGTSSLYTLQYITPGSTGGNAVDIVLSLAPNAPNDLDPARLPIVLEKSQTITLPQRFAKFGSVQDLIRTDPSITVTGNTQTITITSLVEANAYIVRTSSGEDAMKSFHLSAGGSRQISMSELPDDMCSLVVESNGKLIEFTTIKTGSKKTVSVMKPLLRYKDGIK